MDIIATGVFIKDNKLLLEERREDEDNYAGFWSFPGGHMKEDETPEQALKREMKEELEVEIIKFKKLGSFKDKDPTSKKEYNHIAFLCTGWDKHISGTTEQKQVRWIKINEIEKIPNLTSFIKDIIEAVRKEI